MNRMKDYLEIGNQNEVYYIETKDILYVEADGNYCNLYLCDGDVLRTLSFQRAEIARNIVKQCAESNNFALLGKFFLINTQYVMHIHPQHNVLTFSINKPGTCQKITINASSTALRALRAKLDREPQSMQIDNETAIANASNKTNEDGHNQQNGTRTGICGGPLSIKHSIFVPRNVPDTQYRQEAFSEISQCVASDPYDIGDNEVKMLGEMKEDFYDDWD